MEIKLLNTSIIILLMTIGLFVLGLIVTSICNEVKGKKIVISLMVMSGICGVFALVTALIGFVVSLIN